MSISVFKSFTGFREGLTKDTIRLFLLIFITVFMIDASFCLLRNIRYAMVATGSDAGSELMPYMQFWVGMPAALFMVSILAKISKVISPEKVFYLMCSAFIAFFAIFALVIFPARHETITFLQTVTNENPLIMMVKLWDMTIFYVISGLWKIIILQVLFWGYVNRHIVIGEAKKIYGPLMLAGAGGGIFAGNISNITSNAAFIERFNIAGVSQWHSSLIIQTVIFSIIAFIILFLFSRLAKMLTNRHVDSDCSVAQAKREKKESYRQSLSLRTSLQYVIKRPILVAMGTIVLMSYIAISLCEIVYLNKLREVYPDPVDYTAFQGRFSIWTGVGIFVSAMFVSTPLIQKGKWILLSVVSPAILLVTSIIFFFFAIYADSPWMSDFSDAVFNCSPMMVAAIAGAFMRSIYSATKNTILLATKELAYVTLSDEDQLKGKFVVDGIIPRMGNSMASVITQTLIIVFGTLDACLPLVGIISIGFIALWTKSALKVGQHMVENTKDPATNQDEEPMAKAA